MRSSLESLSDLRARLAAARLMLVFSPAASGARDALDALAALAPEVDVVQVRPKPLGDAAPGATLAVTSARACIELTRAVQERLRRAGARPLVIVNDRVDVALALADGEDAVDGVHLGADDLPPEDARPLLGERPLIGLSTHSLEDVARAEERPVDYLGFGPVHATATKGYGRGLGTELAWIASAASGVPLFPIGGIDATNVDQLGHVGRAAVGSFLLAAPDPAAAARELRERLEAGRDA